MTRFVITLVAFGLPFLLFWIYTKWQQRRRIEGASDPWPLAVLWLTGAVLAVEALALTAMSERAPPGSVYVPAHIEDGRVVPWRFEQPAPAPPAPAPPAPDKTQ